MKMKEKKRVNIPNKPKPSPEWEVCWKMRQQWRSSKWWRSFNSTTKDLQLRRNKEKQNGDKIRRNKINLKFQGLTWATSWLRIDKLQCHNLLHIDMFLTTLKVFVLIKLRISNPKERDKFSPRRVRKDRIKMRNTSGQFKIWLTTNSNLIMKLS